MAEVKILIQGFVEKRERNIEAASPTVTLVRDDGVTILVDPGTVNPETLSAVLKKNELTFKDIHLIFLTHKHLDHCKSVALFPNAKIIDNWGITEGNKLGYRQRFSPTKNTEIIETPGHSEDGISLIVNTEKGKILIVGDVFWWREGQEQKTDKESLMRHEDPYAMDEETLNKSRGKILEIADRIIPGHGKMFRVE